jgi:hypothetical protein
MRGCSWLCVLWSTIDVIGQIRVTGSLTVKSRSADGLVTVRSRSSHSLPTLRSRSGKTFAYIEIHLSATLPCLDSDIQLDIDRLLTVVCSSYAAGAIFQTGFPFRRFVWRMSCNFQLDLLVYVVAATYLATVYRQSKQAVTLLKTCSNGIKAQQVPDYVTGCNKIIQSVL